MNLISLFVVVFTLAVDGIYYLVPAKCQYIVLCVSSLLFFAVYSPIGAAIVIAQTLFALLISKAIGKEQKQKKKKALLWVSIVVFLTTQVSVKYLYFWGGEQRPSLKP